MKKVFIPKEGPESISLSECDSFAQYGLKVNGKRYPLGWDNSTGFAFLSFSEIVGTDDWTGKSFKDTLKRAIECGGKVYQFDSQEELREWLGIGKKMG